jgi:hypothetical protein
MILALFVGLLGLSLVLPLIGCTSSDGQRQIKDNTELLDPPVKDP